jgi:hypothetical protein
MGYSVYWSNRRWQGYGVPAYCDYPECKNEIDRGLGYQHEDDKENGTPSVFCCSDHQTYNYDEFNPDLTIEHPEWIEHVLTDDSWDEWRKENPELVNKYQKYKDSTHE